MKVLFVCTHGGAKSVIAASFFNRLAEQPGLPVAAVAASAEEPYDSVPAPVADFLRGDGFDVSTFTPRRVEAAEMRGATRVVAIGCELPEAHERWDDVPAASEDLEGSAEAIRRHVDKLIEELRVRS